MNNDAAIPWKLPRGLRIRLSAILGVGLAALPLGCSEDPKPTIAGKAHVFMIGNVDGKHYPFTMDTGNDGATPIQTNDPWVVLCDVSDPDSPWMKIYRTDSDAVDLNIPYVGITFLKVYPDSSKEAGIAMDLADFYFVTGACKVNFERTSDDPAEGTFSAPACDVATKDGQKGHLEFAQFHASSCNTEPIE